MRSQVWPWPTPSPEVLDGHHVGSTPGCQNDLNPASLPQLHKSPTRSVSHDGSGGDPAPSLHDVMSATKPWHSALPVVAGFGAASNFQHLPHLSLASPLLFSGLSLPDSNPGGSDNASWLGLVTSPSVAPPVCWPRAPPESSSVAAHDLDSRSSEAKMDELLEDPAATSRHASLSAEPPARAIAGEGGSLTEQLAASAFPSPPDEHVSIARPFAQTSCTEGAYLDWSPSITGATCNEVSLGPSLRGETLSREGASRRHTPGLAVSPSQLPSVYRPSLSPQDHLFWDPYTCTWLGFMDSTVSTLTARPGSAVESEYWENSNNSNKTPNDDPPNVYAHDPVFRTDRDKVDYWEAQYDSLPSATQRAISNSKGKCARWTSIKYYHKAMDPRYEHFTKRCTNCKVANIPCIGLKVPVHRLPSNAGRKAGTGTKCYCCTERKRVGCDLRYPKNWRRAELSQPSSAQWRREKRSLDKELANQAPRKRARTESSAIVGPSALWLDISAAAGVGNKGSEARALELPGLPGWEFHPNDPDHHLPSPVSPVTDPPAKLLLAAAPNAARHFDHRTLELMGSLPLPESRPASGRPSATPAGPLTGTEHAGMMLPSPQNPAITAGQTTINNVDEIYSSTHSSPHLTAVATLSDQEVWSLFGSPGEDDQQPSVSSQGGTLSTPDVAGEVVNEASLSYEEICSLFG